MNQEKTSEKRLRILKSAANLIAQNGYYGVGLKEILDTCGIPKGSFYYFFPNGKNQLGVEVLNYAYERMEKGILTSIFPVSDNAVEVFVKMAHHIADMLTNNKGYATSLVITFIGIEASDISAEMEAAAKQVYIRWIRLYQDKLTACGYSEEKAANLAPQICALIHGMTLSCWIRKDTSELSALEPAIRALLEK